MSAQVTATGIRDGDPAVLQALVHRRGAAVLAYCERACAPSLALDAAADAFVRFRAQVLAAERPSDINPEVALLSATRHAAAARAPRPPARGGATGLGRLLGAKAPTERLPDVPNLLADRADGTIGAEDGKALDALLDGSPVARSIEERILAAEEAYRTAPRVALPEPVTHQIVATMAALAAAPANGASATPSAEPMAPRFFHTEPPEAATPSVPEPPVDDAFEAEEPGPEDAATPPHTVTDDPFTAEGVTDPFATELEDESKPSEPEPAGLSDATAEDADATESASGASSAAAEEAEAVADQTAHDAEEQGIDEPTDVGAVADETVADDEAVADETAREAVADETAPEAADDEAGADGASHEPADVEAVAEETAPEAAHDEVADEPPAEADSDDAAVAAGVGSVGDLVASDSEPELADEDVSPTEALAAAEVGLAPVDVDAAVPDSAEIAAARGDEEVDPSKTVEWSVPADELGESPEVEREIAAARLGDGDEDPAHLQSASGAVPEDDVSLPPAPPAPSAVPAAHHDHRHGLPGRAALAPAAAVVAIAAIGAMAAAGVFGGNDPSPTVDTGIVPERALQAVPEGEAAAVVDDLRAGAADARRRRLADQRQQLAAQQAAPEPAPEETATTTTPGATEGAATESPTTTGETSAPEVTTGAGGTSAEDATGAGTESP